MKRSILFCIISLSFGSLFSQIQTVGLIQNDSTAFNGYTLFTPMGGNNTYLIDNCGYSIKTWESGFDPGLSVYLLENGHLLRTARIPSLFTGGGSGGRMELFNWEGDLIWSYEYSSETYHQHHDIYPMPNGNILILAWEAHHQGEAILKGFAPSVINPEGIWTTQIVEIEPIIGANEATIVWQWNLWDHLVQDIDPSLSNFGDIAAHPELINCNFGPSGERDWIHANGIDYNAELDQIIINSRNFNEFWVIDHSTTTEEAASHSGGNSGKGGDILYRWGNPAAYDRGIILEQRLWRQHNAHWVPNGLVDEGKIMIFNNGLGRPDGSYSTVDVINPPIDAQGNYMINGVEPFGPEDLSWIYKANPPNSFFSGRISGAQRLPNGNTLICEGNEGRFFEVDYEGNIVWTYMNPIRQGMPLPQGVNPNQTDVFRVTRYAPDYPAFIGKDLTPGQPLEANPIEYDCTIFEGMTSSVTEIAPLNIQVRNNPFDSYLYIDNKNNEFFNLQIFNVLGQLIFSKSTNSSIVEIPTSYWQKGMYVVQFFNKNYKQQNVQKILKQ